MSCLTILGVEMQAVDVLAQRHQHTQANWSGFDDLMICRFALRKEGSAALHDAAMVSQ